VPVKGYFDLTISAGILLTLLSLLIGGAMKWQGFEDQLRHETEMRTIADASYHERIESAHEMIRRDMQAIEDKLTRAIGACK